MNDRSAAAGTFPASPARLCCVDLPGLVGPALERMPHVLRILAENALRQAIDSGGTDLAAVIRPFDDWLQHGESDFELSFMPTRVLMHDTTCVPALVDIAAMRDAVAEAGGDPASLRPLLPVDVSVDHSINVDVFGQPGALAANMAREMQRNAERYRFMKWATRALPGVRVHPPGTGIMHTINLEQLATVVGPTPDGRWLAPDTLIGTDSHTPMINGLGVLAWGVGGLEAESVLFGSPVQLLIPRIIGIRLEGRLRDGVLATDLALTVAELLRKHGVASEFVEFFGPGVSTLSVGERAVVANMAPEYGVSSGLFPIDANTLDYLRATGRSHAHVEIVESYARQQHLWFEPDAAPVFSVVLEIDLEKITPSLAGPRRPQDRIAPAEAAASLAPLATTITGTALPESERPPAVGAVAVAAITSCTNTSDARLSIIAGLLARKARKLGLRPPGWVKTSLAPGSPSAEAFLRRAGLLEDLEALGFGIVGYGCTTCIGQSGPLAPAMQAEIAARKMLPVAVLSGNRNFPGRVHPQIEAGFLASPPLVIAYALAGDVNRDILTDPVGFSSAGRPVLLSELWPSTTEIDEAMNLASDPRDYATAFAAAAASPAWRDLDAPEGDRFPWDPGSTYLRRPPFVAADPGTRLGHYLAAPLIVLGNDMTTDHISPAGQIPTDSDAARWLIAHGADPADLNVYASRRGNWEVMLRGIFTNRAARNLLAPDLRPGETVLSPGGEHLSVWQAADRYRAAGQSTVIVAGERYGTGSSRDWAAKGAGLLHARAVLAVSFERIHRSNLIGMGVVPLRLPDGWTPAGLDLSPDDRIEIEAPETLSPRARIPVAIRRAGGGVETGLAILAAETSHEMETLRAGGIIPLMLRRAGSAGQQ